MNSRDKILQRLRAAAPQMDGAELPLQPDAAYFQDMPEQSAAAMIEQFSEKLTALSGEFILVDNEKAAATQLLALIESAGAGRCLVQADAGIERVLAREPELSARCDILPADLDGHQFAEHPAGLSAVDFLVARTGSVVLRNTGSGGRRLSVLPPVHIALAWQNQLVASLDSALQAENFNGSEWSYASIVTGPSRTADIQKNLVLGAHGPKRLIVVLIKKDRE